MQRSISRNKSSLYPCLRLVSDAHIAIGYCSRPLLFALSIDSMKRPGIARYYATALLANLSQGYLDGECLFRVGSGCSLNQQAVIDSQQRLTGR